MKTHLLSFMQYACGAELAGKSSSNIENITCENCKRTNLYKRLKSEATQKLKDETMQIGKDIVAAENNIDKATKESICKSCSGCPTNTKSDKQVKYDFTGNYVQNCTHYKSMKPTTYFQKLQINVEVPIGFEISTENISQAENLREVYLHFKPKVKQGAELIGCLCGVSNSSLQNAKRGAENQYDLCRITDFVNDDEKYNYRHGIYSKRYAYPVNKQKLEQLIERLEK